MNRLEAPLPIVRIQGYWRTGTSWTQQLIRKNIPEAFVTMYTLGYKHHLTDPKEWMHTRRTLPIEASGDDRRYRTELTIEELETLAARLHEVKVALISKHPFAWAASMTRHRPAKFHDLHHRSLHIANYNRLYAGWLKQAEAAPDQWSRVRYIDLLASPETLMRAIAHRIVGRDLPWFRSVTQIVSPSNKVTSTEFSRYKYYLEAQYMDELPEQVKDELRDDIDWGLFKRYGYAMDPPPTPQKILDI